jgi:hypothetical protein
MPDEIKCHTTNFSDADCDTLRDLLIQQIEQLGGYLYTISTNGRCFSLLLNNAEIDIYLSPAPRDNYIKYK